MKRISLSLLLLVQLAFQLSAQPVPSTLNYQGRLTDNTPSQTPVTATVPMTFAIWDAPTAGASQWTESWSVVAVTGGIFSVLLGSNGTPIPPTVFQGGASRYLEITANGEFLTPRQQIGSEGYARVAEKAADSTQLGGITGSAYLLADGSRAMTGSLNLGSNTVTSAGAINGVAIAAHAARHQPTGADPLTTGTPVNIGTVNTAGTANSFARADHVHALGTVGTGNGGTGITTAPTAAGQFLRSTGAGAWGVGTIQPADVPAAGGATSQNFASLFRTTQMVVVTGGAVLFDSTAAIDGLTYNPLTGTLTYTASGTYMVTYGVYCTTANREVGLQLNGVTVAGSRGILQSNTYTTLSIMLTMLAGDTLRLVNTSGTVITIGSTTAGQTGASLNVVRIQ